MLITNLVLKSLVSLTVNLRHPAHQSHPVWRYLIQSLHNCLLSRSCFAGAKLPAVYQCSDRWIHPTALHLAHLYRLTLLAPIHGCRYISQLLLVVPSVRMEVCLHLPGQSHLPLALRRELRTGYADLHFIRWESRWDGESRKYIAAVQSVQSQFDRIFLYLYPCIVCIRKL